MKIKTIATQTGTLIAATLATACCWIPLLIAVTGITAAGVGMQLEAYSGYFYGLTAILLAYSFWEGFIRHRGEQCDPCDAEAGDGEARAPTRAGQARLFFGVHLVLVVALLSLPTLMTHGPTALASPQEMLEEGQEDSSQEATISVKGMTCGGCVATVETAIAEVDGVRSGEVSLEKEEAVVQFDDAVVSASDIAARIAADGYEVDVIAEGDEGEQR